MRRHQQNETLAEMKMLITKVGKRKKDRIINSDEQNKNLELYQTDHDVLYRGLRRQQQNKTFIYGIETVRKRREGQGSAARFWRSMKYEFGVRQNNLEKEK